MSNISGNNIKTTPNLQSQFQESQATSSAATKQTSAAEEIALLSTFGLSSMTSTGKAPESNVAPPQAPQATMTNTQEDGYASFTTNINATVGASLKHSGESSIDNLNADNLTAYCLKLDVEDPNNCVETHNALSEVNSDLRQAEIEKAKQENIEAQKKLKEAEELAAKMKIFSAILTIVSIALLICTLGAAAPVAAAGVAAAGTAAGAGAAASAAATQVATQVAAQAATEAAKQVAVQGAQQAVQQTLNQSLQQVANQAVKECCTKAATEAAAKAAAKGATEEAIKQAAQEAAKKAVSDGTAKAAAEKAVQEVAKQGVQAANQSLAQGATNQVVQQATTSAVEQGSAQAVQNAVKDGALKQAVKYVQQKMGTKGFSYYVKAQGAKAGGEGMGEAQKANIMADAHRHQLNAKIHELNADKAQDMIENEAEENKMIMENVNTAFTRAIESLGRSHAAKSKLIASAKV